MLSAACRRIFGAPGTFPRLAGFLGKAGRLVMPQGQKQNSDKQAGKAVPIAEPRGAPMDEVERPPRTVAGNDDGGDKRPGGSDPSPAIGPAAAATKAAAPGGSDAKRSEPESPPTASAGLAAEGRRPRMDDREQRIREIAYFLWKQEGYPDGRAEEHWAAAEAVVDAQDAEPKVGKEDPQGKPLKK
jgi:hypothetical protein